MSDDAMKRGPIVVDVPSFPRPRGYANGMVAEGRFLAIAGQVGWNNEGVFAETDMLGQLAQAIDNVLAVVAAAGGAPTDLVQMTFYVTDLPAYRACLRELGGVWKARLGRHYPAMAVVGTSELVEPLALIEIVALAVLPSSPEPKQPRTG